MATLQPPPLQDAWGSYRWVEWFRKISNILTTTGAISWSLVDKAGSNLTEIATRLHNSLQTIQGGTTSEYYHLTSAQHTDLTDAGDSTSHYHAADRARTNHTGTQNLSTIGDVTMTVANLNSLDDGADTSLHYHSADRNRSNHTGRLACESYTVAGLPAATTAAQIIYVSNETGGAVLAFSDGTNWRRVTDRAIVA